MTDNDKAQTRYGIFNKHNGVLFSFEEEKDVAERYNKDHFLVKEIVLRPNEYYFGDYYTGQVYSEEAKPLIREDEMQENFFKEVINRYSLIKQIMLIVGVLETNEHIVKTEGFKHFATFLRQQKARYDQSLKVVSEDKESFNFVSKEDVEEITKKRMEGIT